MSVSQSQPILTPRGQTEAEPSAASDTVLGIECRHHYGTTTHALVPGEAIAQTVYGLVREWHKREDGGLTDDNHSWEVAKAEKPGFWDRVVIRKNARSPWFLIKPWWVDDGAGAVWFSQEFRLATTQTIDAEIAEHVAWQLRWMENAARQRETLRGGKARQKYEGLARRQGRMAVLVARRWPAYAAEHGAVDTSDAELGPGRPS